MSGEQVETSPRWRVSVTVVPKAGVNDPEGEAILGGLRGLGFANVERVRAGRFFVVDVPAADADAAVGVATQMAEQLLANPVIQQFAIDHVTPLAD